MNYGVISAALNHYKNYCLEQVQLTEKAAGFFPTPESYRENLDEKNRDLAAVLSEIEEVQRRADDPHTVTVEVRADTSQVDEALARASRAASELCAKLEQAEKQANASAEALAAAARVPFPPRATPRPDTIPADIPAAPADYEPTTADDDGMGAGRFEYGTGYANGAFVFCPRCGRAVSSAWDGFTSQADADKYALEHCPVCNPWGQEYAEAVAELRDNYPYFEERAIFRLAVYRGPRRMQEDIYKDAREWFLKDLEYLVMATEPGVVRLTFRDMGGPTEAVQICYKSGHTVDVSTAHDSLLAIAKDVFRALEY